MRSCGATRREENRERAASRMQQWKPDLYKWVATGDHNHPVDFEFPGDHGHMNGDVPHHHGDSDYAHSHAAKKKRRRK